MDVFHAIVFFLTVDFTQNLNHVDIFRELAVPYFGDRIETRVLFDVVESLVHAFGDRVTFYAEALAFASRSAVCVKGCFGAV